jgi:glycosyltransferase involved in cell wall biosynthesis
MILFSVIIPYFNKDAIRFRNLLNTLDCINAQEPIIHNGIKIKPWEIILVEQTFKPDLFLVGNYDSPITFDADNKKFFYIYNKGKFNKSWCINYAVKRSNADICIIIDADMIFDNQYFKRIIEKSNELLPFFICWNKIIKQQGKDEPVERIAKDTKTAGGVFCFNKQFFFELGAMNEVYDGYGGEDHDLWVRAYYKLGKKMNYMNETIIHQYHDNEPQNEKCYFYLDRTIQNIDTVIERLKDHRFGEEYPRAIKMNDLYINTFSLRDKRSPGIEDSIQ